MKKIEPNKKKCFEKNEGLQTVAFFFAKISGLCHAKFSSERMEKYFYHFCYFHEVRNCQRKPVISAKMWQFLMNFRIQNISGVPDVIHTL